LSFVPDAEQRLWRTVMRRRYQITRNRVQLHNRLEALLEEAHIKVSSLVSDLLGISARRMLQALADGETDPAALATLATARLRATPEQLCDAFQACPTLHPVYRRLLKLTLEELRVIEDHLGQLDQQMADLLTAHHDAVHRLAEVPGLGVDSAQQIIAEVGATAATFPSSKHLASWMGACPGNEESAGVNYSHRCPKGNRQMRRVLNQAANAAVKAKGTIFNVVYRRLVPRLGHAQAIGAITHRLCRLIWKILHERVRCEERGPSVWRALLTWIHRERYGDCSTASACKSSTITTRACDAFVFNRIEIVRGAASGLFGGGALDRTINYGHKAPPSGDRPTSICRRPQIARASAHKTGYQAGFSSGRAIREYCEQTCHAVPVPDRRLRASHHSRVDQTYSSIR
jgi:transposase